MHHEHAQMPTSEHTEPEVNSHDVITSNTGNNGKTAFSLQVVESVSDKYN